MVQIITDASTLYTVEEARELGFEVSPLCVNIGDLDARDLQLDMKDFYGRIKRGEIPKSSQPPVGEVLDLYEKYSDTQIINIAMADGLSGTYQSACGARETVENKEKITVFNTRTLCGPHRYMVEKAQKMKQNGCGVKEIMEWLEYAADRHESFFIPQDFDFLRRGGRLTPVAAALGSVLKLRPIMTQTKDGKKLDERHIVYVSHADAIEDAKTAITYLREAFANVEINQYSKAYTPIRVALFSLENDNKTFT